MIIDEIPTPQSFGTEFEADALAEQRAKEATWKIYLVMMHDALELIPNTDAPINLATLPHTQRALLRSCYALGAIPYFVLQASPEIVSKILTLNYMIAQHEDTHGQFNEPRLVVASGAGDIVPEAWILGTQHHTLSYIPNGQQLRRELMYQRKLLLREGYEEPRLRIQGDTKLISNRTLWLADPFFYRFRDSHILRELLPPTTPLTDVGMLAQPGMVISTDRHQEITHHMKTVGVQADLLAIYRLDPSSVVMFKDERFTERGHVFAEWNSQYLLEYGKKYLAALLPILAMVRGEGHIFITTGLGDHVVQGFQRFYAMRILQGVCQHLNIKHTVLHNQNFTDSVFWRPRGTPITPEEIPHNALSEKHWQTQDGFAINYYGMKYASTSMLLLQVPTGFTELVTTIETFDVVTPIVRHALQMAQADYVELLEWEKVVRAWEAENEYSFPDTTVNF